MLAIGGIEGMGIIVQFPERSDENVRTLRVADLNVMRGGAEILLFTGVRYERQGDVSDAVSGGNGTEQVRDQSGDGPGCDRDSLKA